MGRSTATCINKVKSMKSCDDKSPSPTLAPRLLSKARAAAYCGLSPARFDRWRKDGMMPGPLPGTSRWDRAEIDAAIENLKALGKVTAPAPPPPVEEDPLAAWLAKKGKSPCKA